MGQSGFWDGVPRRTELSQGDAFECVEDTAHFSTSHQSQWPIHASPRPFDRDACQTAYLTALSGHRNTYRPGMLFEHTFELFAEQLGLLTRQEARFWLRALCHEEALKEMKLERFSDTARTMCERRLQGVDVSTPMTPGEIVEGFDVLLYAGNRTHTTSRYNYLTRYFAPLALCVRVECGVKQGLQVLFVSMNPDEYGDFFYHFGSTQGHEQDACAQMRECVDDAVFLCPRSSHGHSIANVLERCPDPEWARRARDIIVAQSWTHFDARGRLPMMWQTPEEVILWFKACDEPMVPGQVRDFYGRFGDPSLELLMKHISGRWNKKSRSKLLKAMWPVCSPKMAVWMLDCAQKEETREAARHWLYGEGVHATLGLMQIVKSRGKRRNQAIVELRALVERGHLDEIKGLMPHVTSPTARELITQEVLQFEPEQLDEATTDELPEWAVCVQSMAWIEQAELDKLVEFFDLNDAPRVKLEGSEHVLSIHVLARLLVLADKVFPRDKRKGKAGAAREAREALQAECKVWIGRVREGVDAQGLGEWLWHVLETWWAKDKPFGWASCLALIGHCATDHEAVLLEPRIQQGARWFPSSDPKRHMREAVDGLGRIGTPASQMLLDGLRRDGRSGWLREHAGRTVKLICEERGWSEAMWEDRSVSHGGLDERGTRVFDYGTRQFELRFRGAFDVEFVNAQGEHFTRLPAARKSDDVDLVRAARQDYKVTKAQLDKIIAGQTRRFEKAMLNLHEWSAKDWWRWIARHPLLHHFARKLIWLRRDARGIEHSFVLTPEGTTINSDYDEVVWGDEDVYRVRVLHPADLDATQLMVWVELCADFEIVQPFVQLEREVYRPASEINEFFAQVNALLSTQYSWKWLNLLNDEYGDRVWDSTSDDYMFSALWRDYGAWRVVMIFDVRGWRSEGQEDLPGKGVYLCRGNQLEPEAIVEWDEAPAMVYSEACLAAKGFLK